MEYSILVLYFNVCNCILFFSVECRVHTQPTVNLGLLLYLANKQRVGPVYRVWALGQFAVSSVDSHQQLLNVKVLSPLTTRHHRRRRRRPTRMITWRFTRHRRHRAT